MIVHNNIHLLPKFKNAVITIGTFDGVHNGHRQIIELMKLEAQKVNGETIIITFNPHPRQIILSNKNQTNQKISLLNTLPEKINLLEKIGINHLVIVPFSNQFANQTPEDYINNFLIKTFNPHTIVIGHDHRFGKDRIGDYALLQQKAHDNNYVVKEIPKYMLHNITISSTIIREDLLNAHIENANHFLGYQYFFSGKVVEGNKLGRTIGFATANIQIDDENKLIPANGVYAVKINCNQLMKKGMMNIGVRPTVGGTDKTIEVNIFDFDETIYGQIITVHIIGHLRQEIKFEGLDMLKKQLSEDKKNALKMLASF